MKTRQTVSLVRTAHSLVCLFLAGCALSAAAAPARNALPLPSCDRACLLGVVDQYLEAFIARDPGRLPWASDLQATENNVEVRIGDGVWAVVTGKGNQDLTVADPLTGQAAYFGVIHINGVPAWYGLRLKVVDRRISEVEVLWRPRPRELRPASPGNGDPETLRHDAEMFLSLKPEERTPRLRMIDLAEGYFSTLQLNDGHLFTVFTPDCSRNDNGTLTAGVPDSPDPMTRLPCAEQFKTGRFRFDNAVRERDYPLVDEEKGIVLARAFLDHDSRVINYQLVDGTPASTNFRVPHTFGMLELFKIKAGAIHRIYVNHIDLPYYSSSPWTAPRPQPQR